MPLDPAIEAQIKEILKLANTALSDVYEGNPSRSKYLDAIVALFSEHMTMTPALSQELKKIAEAWYANFELDASEEALDALHVYIQDLLQNAIDHPDDPFSKGKKLLSEAYADTDEEDMSDVDTSSIDTAVRETANELDAFISKPDARNADEKVFDTDSDDDDSLSLGDEGEDLDQYEDPEKIAANIDAYIAKAEAELDAANQDYGVGEKNDTTAVDADDEAFDDEAFDDEPNAEAMQAFIEAELEPEVRSQYSKLFHTYLAEFETASLHGNQSNFVGETVGKIIKDLSTLYQSHCDKPLTKEGLDAFEAASEGILMSWGRLVNMKLKTNEYQNASLRKMVAALSTLSTAIPELNAAMKAHLLPKGPSLK
ncbi:MAG: hypothetical protein NXI01_05410 [Gammaproteobacteria bacterium]|nr:hypothetical protein [Gammaproteobacteria bacterium]